MLDFITWWIAVEALGLLVLPLSFLLFSRLPDRGYAFAKPLGLVLLGYLVWLVGLTGLVPLNRWSILAIAALLAAGCFWLIRGQWRSLLGRLYAERWTILTVELIFLAAFAGWAVARSYDPAINHTEQPMDFAFLNAVIRADSMPPLDPWLSGNSISYYYFGYLINGSIAKVTGVSGGVSYNLALALLFALTAVGAFGLVANLVRIHRGVDRPRIRAPIAVGLLASVFVVGIGNLQSMAESVRSLGLGTDGFWNWTGVKGIEGSLDGTSLFPSDPVWWWRSTRVIEASEGGVNQAITEFPSFSFVLGDLHPHVMALPFVILALGLGLQALGSSEEFGPGWLKRNPVAFVVIAICLGALGFLNSWDLPTGLAIFLVITLVRSYLVWGRWDWIRLRGWALFALALGILSFLLFLPFYLGPRPSPLFPWVAPVEDVNTRYIHYVLVMGLFLFIGGSFLLLLAWRRMRTRRPPFQELIASISIVLAPFLVWTMLILLLGLVRGQGVDSLEEVGIRFLRLLPLHGILALGLLTIIGSARRRADVDRSRTLFPLTLLLVGLFLTLGPELFRIVDVFGDRMNTVFKFYYQAWIMLALASAYAVYYLVAHWNWEGIWRKVMGGSWVGVAAVLVVGSLLFPFGALYDKTGSFSAQRTLDGLAFVRDQDVSKTRALDFLIRDSEEDSVIVEAVAVDESGRAGGDYDPSFARVSSRTGLPTILGWAGHEEQWRGNRRSFRERAQDVMEIYTGSDIEATRELLAKYDVTYVYVGALERSLYALDDTSKFDTLMDRPFDQGTVTIYRVRTSP